MVRTVDGIYNRYQSQFNTQSLRTSLPAVMRLWTRTKVSGRHHHWKILKQIWSRTSRKIPGGETRISWTRQDLSNVAWRADPHRISGAGKSICSCTLVIKAALKRRVGILSMEQYPNILLQRDIRMICGKPLEKNIRSNDQSWVDLGMQWVHEHFYYIYPSSQILLPKDPGGLWSDYQVWSWRRGGRSIQLASHMTQVRGRDDRYIPQCKKEWTIAFRTMCTSLTSHTTRIGKKDDGPTGANRWWDLRWASLVAM